MSANLSRLFDDAATPPTVHAALAQHFETVESVEIVAGGWPFQYLLACRDANRCRLVVLFGWLNGAWQYQPHSPVILRQLRLCGGQ